jgi:HSP20 family protein
MRSTPFGDGLYAVNRLREEMDRVLGKAFGDSPGQAREYPPVNVWEDEDNVYFEAELPGLALEDLEIQVKGDELRISGERKSRDGKDVVCHRRERGTGKFARTLLLPVMINVDNVSARLVDGVLSLTLPKAEESKPRKIEVKCA